MDENQLRYGSSCSVISQYNISRPTRSSRTPHSLISSILICLVARVFNVGYLGRIIAESAGTPTRSLIHYLQASPLHWDKIPMKPNIRHVTLCLLKVMKYCSIISSCKTIWGLTTPYIRLLEYSPLPCSWHLRKIYIFL